MTRRRGNRPILPPSVDTSIDAATNALLAEAQALSARLAALNEVAVAMQRTNEVEAMLQTMADQARWVLDFQLCTITTRSAERLQTRVLRQTGFAAIDLQISAHRPAIERVLKQGHAVMQVEIPPSDDPPPGMRSAIILPLISRDQILGTLNFYTSTVHTYSQDDLRVATALSTQVAAIIVNARSYAETQRARDELHTVLESIGDAVLVLDKRARILLSNRAFLQLLGLPAPIALGTSLLRLIRQSGQQIVRSHDLAALVSIVRQVAPLFDQQRQSASVSGTLRLANDRYAAWVANPLLHGAGIVFSMRDVTAQIQLEQLREDMVRMLVHDFRTPLTSMSMGIDMLDMYNLEGDHEEHHQMSEMVRRSITALLDQVDNLLDVSKFESGRMVLERSPLLISALFEAAYQAVQPIAQYSEQQVIIDLPPNLPLLEADLALMRRVIDNLLGNALKFTPNGGQIVLSAKLLDASIEIAVRDTGPGVPPNQREQIFEKYGQAHQVGVSPRKRGTGLGLTFCQLAVEAHGGTIGVRDAEGGGSVFWFRLPLTQPPS